MTLYHYMIKSAINSKTCHMKFTFIRVKKFLFCFCLLFLFACKNQSISGKEEIKKETIKEDSIIPAESIEFENQKANKTVQENVNEDNSASSIEDQNKNDNEVQKPKGYIIKDNTVLFESSNVNSKQIGKLKKGENIYLIETSLNDEKGKFANYPTWYKVQITNKKIGWVESSKVSFGH